MSAPTGRRRVKVRGALFAPLALIVLCAFSTSGPPTVRDAAGEAATRSADTAGSADTAAILAGLKAGRWDAVVADCLAAAERRPGDARLYSWLAQAVDSCDDQARPAAASRAVDVLERLLRQRPDNLYYHYGLGLLDQRQRAYAQARAHLKESIARGASFWQPYEELVNCYQSFDDILDARTFLTDRLKQEPANPFLYQAVGVVHYFSSEYREAFDDLEKARALFHARADLEAEAACLLNLSDVFTYFNDYPGALEKARAGLRLARDNGFPALEAACLEREAFVLSDLGKNAEAHEACLKSRAIAEAVACRRVEILCDRTFGVIFLDRGDLGRARDFLGRALESYRKADALRSQDICLYWLTLLHKASGDYAKAMDAAREALGISRKIGFKTGEAFHLTAIGDIYLSLGDYERALEYNKQALTIAETYIGKWSREECLNTIGFVYIKLADYRAALDYFRAALRYITQIGHRREEARCLYNIGCAGLKLGDLSGARESFLQSLAAAEASGNKVIQADDLNRLGDLYRAQSDWDQAGRAYGRAQAIGRDIGQPDAVWESYAGLGALAAARRDFGGAAEHYQKAVAVIEDLRVQFLLREESSGFFESKVPLYEALVNALFESHAAGPAGASLEDCLFYAEKAKARSFLDDLQSARVGPGRLPGEGSDEMDILGRSIARFSAALGDKTLGPSDLDSVRAQLETAEERYRQLVEKAKAENPRYANVVYREPSRLPDIARRLVDPSTALVEFFLAEDDLYIFVVTARGLAVERLVPPDSLQTLRLAARYVELLSSKGISCLDAEPAGRRLYKALFAPRGTDMLAGVRNLVVIPDRWLSYLPFEALVSADGPATDAASVHFLMKDCAVSYAPSASTLVSIVERSKAGEDRRDLLAVGNPVLDAAAPDARARAGLREFYSGRRFALRPLEFASREMTAISRLIARDSRTVLSGPAATKGRLKEQRLSGFKILHFATHGLVDEKSAARSALVLTPDPGRNDDGILQAGEIYRLRLDADLVVLSACRSARGKVERGEGIEGLARAFFCAGARSVVASVWNLDDRSTSHLMTSFYRFLTQGLSEREALRRAKIEMIASRESDPHRWAAFVLVGDGRFPIALHKASWWEAALHF